MDDSLSLAIGFGLSAGVGLLIGLERERHPTAKAGVRTFALIAVLGSLAGLLSSATASGWPLAAGAICITATLVAAYLQDRASIKDDSGTTTVVAAACTFFLGAAIYYGYRTPAVALGVGITVLLYFKAELERFSQDLTRQDVRSILQFAVLSAVILPLLPDRGYGPYQVLNPFQLWLMVVLVAGVSLTGYLVWRLTSSRHGIALSGVLGGLVSSTVTTLVHARHAAAGAEPPAAAVLVILLANATMLVRVLMLVGAAAPAFLPGALTVIIPALLAAVIPVARWWRKATKSPPSGEEAFRNPTQLRTALSFAAIYAVILLLVAWANDALGTRGVLILSAISGLTDVDAITLSTMRLLQSGSLAELTAMTALGLAVGSNLVFKAGIAGVVGGSKLRRPVITAFGAPLAGIAAGIWALHALA